MEQVKDLFVEIKKVIQEYKERVAEIDQQERELTADLDALQQEMTNNLLDEETADASAKVYLKVRNREIVQRVEILNVLIEELDEERTALKLSYIPLLREAKGIDSKVKSEYDINAIVDHYRWVMLNEVAEIGKQMGSQYNAVAPDLMEILDDEKVTEVHPRIRYQFDRDSYKPVFWEANKTVISRDNVRYAASGYLPPEIRKPEGIK